MLLKPQCLIFYLCQINKIQYVKKDSFEIVGTFSSRETRFHLASLEVSPSSHLSLGILALVQDSVNGLLMENFSLEIQSFKFIKPVKNILRIETHPVVGKFLRWKKNNVD